jgi:HAD superfamily hydrolase (TIGR01549 family)
MEYAFMKGIKAVVFDCDGVMFDTETSNLTYYNQLLEHFDRPAMTPHQFAFAQMHTVDETLAFLFDDTETHEAVKSYRKTISYLPFLKLVKMEPYLKPLIEKLRPEYKTAIATNRTDTINRLLSTHGLMGYFDLVVTASDVERPKPHPDSLFRVLEHFMIDPDQAIYVGDSKLDEIAARAAGICLVAYNNTALAADFHIKSLKEIEGIIA